ncbi:ATP-binding protein [Pseudonocardia sp. CA-107938]|uniref:ATP-binding protein n=1 Tax=Pseudonocardia sp. CA-107938 TaxID=3240021 RepID=UPI003D9224DE
MSEQLHVAADAEPHLVGVVRFAVSTWLSAVRWPASAADELLFAIGEAASNCVEHAYRGLEVGRMTVDVTAVDEPRAMHVVVTDFGRWRPQRPDAGRGNGLILINGLMAWSRVETDDAGTRVRMRSNPAP